MILMVMLMAFSSLDFHRILLNLTELTWLAAAGKSPLTWRVNAEICYKWVIFQQTMFDCREVSQSMGVCSRCDMDIFLENYIYIYIYIYIIYYIYMG